MRTRRNHSWKKRRDCACSTKRTTRTTSTSRAAESRSRDRQGAGGTVWAATTPSRPDTTPLPPSSSKLCRTARPRPRSLNPTTHPVPGATARTGATTAHQPRPPRPTNTTTAAPSEAAPIRTEVGSQRLTSLYTPVKQLDQLKCPSHPQEPT